MKKVIDIIVKEEKVKTNRPKQSKKRARRVSREITRTKAIFFVLGAVLAVAVGAGAWFTFNSELTIILLVKQEPLELSDEVEVNPSQTAIDLEKRIIPARLLPQTLEKNQTFKQPALLLRIKKPKA